MLQIWNVSASPCSGVVNMCLYYLGNAKRTFDTGHVVNIELFKNIFNHIF